MICNSDVTVASTAVMTKQRTVARADATPTKAPQLAFQAPWNLKIRRSVELRGVKHAPRQSF